jgi:hypothetical protein
MRKRTNKRQIKTKRLFLRVTDEKFWYINKVADDLGITVTELILTRADNKPLIDSGYESKKFLAVHTLTSAMNYVTNNIKQAEIAIHQIHKDKKIGETDFIEFNDLLKKHFNQSDMLKQIFSDFMENKSVG